jgi:mono/diheme cytochrome c family protein
MLFRTILAASLLASPLALAGAVPPEEVTFTKHVARILQENCQECHRPEGIAPLALTTYTQAKNWAPMIREVVSTRRMPPWHADPAIGHFKNDRRLTDEEIATLTAWMDNGFKRGNPEDMPPPLQYDHDWRIGTPDVVLEMPEEVEIPATGVVPYMHITIPTNFTEDKWVKKMDLRAGNPKVVHHILVYARDPEFKQSAANEFLRLGKGFLIGFAPGTVPVDLPDGYAIKVPKGSDLIFQMHYTPTGKPERDRSKIGFVFDDQPPVHEMLTATTVNFEFVIPPHANNHEVTADVTFPQSAVIYGLTPHMHYRGKSFEYIAKYPDGREETLLRVPKFDFNWQTTYILAEPKFLPKGTVMHTIAHFDNSAENPVNPAPDKAVRWGDQTWEEMMIGWMNMSWFDGTEEEYRKVQAEKLGETVAMNQ